MFRYLSTIPLSLLLQLFKTFRYLEEPRKIKECANRKSRCRASTMEMYNIEAAFASSCHPITQAKCSMQNYLRKLLDFSSRRYILWKLLLNHEGIVKWSALISLTLVSVRSATVSVHVCRQKVVVPYCLLAAQKDVNASACKDRYSCWKPLSPAPKSRMFLRTEGV